MSSLVNNPMTDLELSPSVRIPSYEDYNKVSSRAEVNAKVSEGGDPWSGSLEQLKRRTKLHTSGKALENKVQYYAQIGVMLYIPWCYVHEYIAV